MITKTPNEMVFGYPIEGYHQYISKNITSMVHDSGICIPLDYTTSKSADVQLNILIHILRAYINIHQEVQNLLDLKIKEDSLVTRKINEYIYQEERLFILIRDIVKSYPIHDKFFVHLFPITEVMDVHTRVIIIAKTLVILGHITSDTKLYNILNRCGLVNKESTGSVDINSKKWILDYLYPCITNGWYINIYKAYLLKCKKEEKTIHLDNVKRFTVKRYLKDVYFNISALSGNTLRIVGDVNNFVTTVKNGKLIDMRFTDAVNDKDCVLYGLNGNKI